MKHIRRNLIINKVTTRKYTKNYHHVMSSITFFKSNYKYKRRSSRCHINKTQYWQRLLSYLQQKRIEKHKLPAKIENMMEDIQFTKKMSFYKNIKVDKILRIFILIMQQATSTNNNTNNNINYFYLSKSKSGNDRLVTRLVAKIKAINNVNKKFAADVKKNNEDADGNRKHHRAYEDANNDTDINVDISSTTGKISYQQHNYKKVSTITSTQISSQRQSHPQLQATSSPSSQLSQSPTISFTTTTMATFRMNMLLSTPSISNYETCQWTAILRHYIRDNPSAHHHQYHHKPKYIQHHNYSLSHINSLAASGLLNINYSSNKIIGNGSITPRATSMGTSIQSAIPYDNPIWNRSCTLFCLLFTLLFAFAFSIRSVTAGACWQTVLDNGKCNEIFSLNISKSECCGASQEFAYTEREPTNIEYFFATAIGGGMECSPCLESCMNVKCGTNKKCVKRKGRPKCVCAPECGAARRKRKQIEKLTQQSQHHALSSAGNLFEDVPSATRSSSLNIKLENLQQSRDTRSLSSEFINVNLGLENGKDAITKSEVASPIERHHCKDHNQNQRKLLHIQMQHEHEHGQQHDHQINHKIQEPKTNRRILIIANVEHTEKPTTRRLQIFSNVRTTQARRHNIDNNSKKYGQHRDTDLSSNDEENDEEYNYKDAEEDAKDAKKKSEITGDSKSNKNNRNNDCKRFLSPSPSRHTLKTNTKSNSNNNNKNKKKNKNYHDLQATKIRQHFNKNTTRVIQQNGHQAEKTPHHRHHNHSNYHHQQQKQQQGLHHNHHRPQSRGNNKHKHSNKHDHKQQSIVLKKPKKNKDYNITATNININSETNIAFVNTTNTTITTANSNNLSNSNANITAVDATSSTLLQTRIVQITTTTTTPTSLNLSSSSSEAILATTKTTTTLNAAPQDTQSKILLSTITSSSFSTTPLNSAMSADYDAAADDHYHSRLRNRGSKIATSSVPSRTTSSSSASNAQLSAVSAHYSLDVATTMSAKGEGVSLHDHRFEFSTKNTYNNKNNNNDDIIPAFQSNLDNNQQKDQQQTQSAHHYQTPFFDSISEQFDLIGFRNNNKQQLTNDDNVRPLNPVCGTDGRTYNTECQLRKRACRTDNPNLQIAYLGHCRTTCNGVTCLNGLTCVEDQYSMPHCIACKIECPHNDHNNNVVDGTKAVCGADGKTYKSTCDINRMICEIGRSIGVAYPGPCRENQVTCDDINCGSKQVCLIDLLTHKPRCTSCRYKCSRKRRPSFPHFDEGKICGFNNRTYNSWCEMRKDSCSTGFYIDVKYSGDCHSASKF